ncbi:MAG: hypothetical protein MK085_04145 [Phycisphaerales bacterium]|nr:hypothetical protein [Phycisphaerales bacterium]
MITSTNSCRILEGLPAGLAIHAPTTIGLRHNGELAGWLIHHELKQDTRVTPAPGFTPISSGGRSGRR